MNAAPDFPPPPLHRPSPRPRRRRLLAALTAAVALAPGAGHIDARAAQPLEVVRITPQGDDVPAGRQVVIQFDRAVVPLGRMDRASHEVPVRIAPRLACRWRWLDPRTLSCELPPGDALETATGYTVHVDRGLEAVDGSMLERAVTHRFVTERPRLDWAGFETWLAAGRPLLRVTFNQPVSRDGLRRHLFFETPHRPRTAARVAAHHADGAAVLAGGASAAEIAHAALLASTPRRAWLVAPEAALRADVPVALRVEPGIAGTGALAGVERRVAVGFHTFPQPAFLGVRCTDVERREPVVLHPGAVPPGLGPAGPGPCDPLAGVALLFSAPVPERALAGGALTVEPALRVGEGGDAADPFAGRDAAVFLGRAHEQGRAYPVWLRQPLAAHRGYRLTSPPGAVVDAFGRPLAAGIDMRFGTSHRRPRLHLPHPAAVLEHGVDSEVPLYVTNLDRVELEYRRLGGDATARREVAVAPARDVSFAVPLPVRELLGGASGAVSGRLSPVPADAEQDRTRFFAQVTPFAVTVKLGHFSSVAWVTRLDDGEPVAGARIVLHRDRYADLSGPADDATGPFVTDAAGVVALPGAAELDPDLSLLDSWRDEDARLFLRVAKDGELAVLPLDADFRVWTREVWPQRRRAFGHLKTWGTTAQGIYRAGDTVQYKLYVRHQDTRTLVPAPRDGYRLSVVDPRGEKLIDGEPVVLDAFGAAAGEIVLPAGSAVGWHRFLVDTVHGDQTLEAFRVLVSDFTPAPFAVRSDLNGQAFRPGDALEVRTTAALHAGGPYTGADARVTVRLAPRPLLPTHPRARGFRFDTGDADAGRTLLQVQAPLDERGRRRTDLTLPDAGIAYGRLRVESAVRDERGKRVAAQATADFAARDRFVGLRDTAWLHPAGQPAQVDFLVVDASGAPVAGVPVSLEIEREDVFAARVKGAGDSYGTRYERRWEAVGRCDGRSADDGRPCRFAPRAPGRYRVTARIADTADRPHQTRLLTWVQGAGSVVWAQPEDGALAIVAERERYAVGDTARFLVKNPFPGALALVTVERYGVLRSWTRRLEGSTPVIEFPVLADDLPGFHLSVTVASPRVAAPPPDRGQVDLGKPAMRMGYVRVPVDDPVKRLDVTVTPDAGVYRPRDSAAIALEVHARATGAPARAPVQLAVAVLDEAVFDLVAGGSAAFDPYAGFYTPDGLDVVSYSLLTRLVGRQKFERKGASSGGDGGASPGLRDVFRYVGYWNPSLPVDAQGRARFRMTLPDNLTGWRVLALAVTPGDRMGLGQGGFRVNKDTELRPVMPNRISAGDRFRAGFSVLNRTGDARSLRVTVTADGAPLAAPAAVERTVALAPFARGTVWLDVVSSRPGTLRLRASAGDDRDIDALEHRLPVSAPARPEAVAQHAVLGGGASEHAGENVSDDVAEQPVAIPPGIAAGSGDLTVIGSPSVLGNADGAFRHMRDYPYACWEQRLSKAVMASLFQTLREHLDPELPWPGAAALPGEVLAAAQGFQAPGGGMSFWAPEDARASPYLSAYTALAFAWLEGAGHPAPSRVSQRLDAYLAALLRRDVMPDFYSRGMASSVRAVALAARARRGRLSAEDALRHRAALPHMSVFAKAHYVDALWRTLGSHDALDEALASLLGHAHESAGKLALSETADGDGGALLDTPARANCAALSTLSALAADPRLAPALAPLLPKLARSVSAARGRRDHWENTQENVFCMAALADYARRFEPGGIEATLRAGVDGVALGETRFTSRRDPPVTLSRALDAADAGSTRTVRLQLRGTGPVHVTTRLRYALAEPPARRVIAGMSLRREYSVERDGRWQLLASPMRVRRGELVRVDLYLSLPTARHFVVVDDPVPGGVEPVNRDLATASVVDADSGAFEAADGAFWHSRDDWTGFGHGFWSFHHRELRHDAARFFADYLPAGDHHLSYTAQVIAAGSFAVAPAHAQEMYDPDVHGAGLAARLVVTGADAR